MFKILKFLKALIKHFLIGKKLSFDSYYMRLSICNSCEYRKLSNCSICGCSLLEKPKWETESCPKNKW